MCRLSLTSRSSGRLAGSPSRRSADQFREARLVRITDGGAAIGVDPVGVLDPQIIVNLLLELGVGVDLVIHGYCPDSSVAREGSHNGLGRIADERWRRERSEEHTSELQSHSELVCRLLLEKKTEKKTIHR